jgi:hypothetical protein
MKSNMVADKLKNMNLGATRFNFTLGGIKWSWTSWSLSLNVIMGAARFKFQLVFVNLNH